MKINVDPTLGLADALDMMKTENTETGSASIPDFDAWIFNKLGKDDDCYRLNANGRDCLETAQTPCESCQRYADAVLEYARLFDR